METQVIRYNCKQQYLEIRACYDSLPNTSTSEQIIQACDPKIYALGKCIEQGRIKDQELFVKQKLNEYINSDQNQSKN
ncbi:hypothetical protein TTHERM_00348340 (macronuclear) [Tetrahymena thermophila SB210]|uniref:Uncharacterized protein n=1 Tax=Tetrahymena thermophila (strain SB210) TaxID=312017 RepID=I7M9S9_TETTS|nr:hypothetical protein TTHERM_00348340 [Tetrahymena thermophila SB210]EAS02744.1 hypothetical protein TTHERM_00348340 [Tetrahymena thermophila SB210]|eukprot:XP_001022989.1 hypothetical protein TTHERM_00348340 [Tetrahymena thermophila SB210]